MPATATYKPTLLISAQEVVEASFEDSRNFKTVKIKSEVIVAAQEKWIRPVLGEHLYTYLLNAIEQSSINPVHQRLLALYIRPALAYYVKYLLLPMLSRPATNMGLQALETEHSRSVSGREIKSAQEAAMAVADSLAETLSRFLENHKADFPAYHTDHNVKEGTKRRGGVILGRRKPKPPVPSLVLTPAIPSQYSYINTANDLNWVFSYSGLIRNEGVQVAKVFDAQGNDITDYANILVNDESQTVLLTFSHAAFLNPNDKTGSVLLMTRDVLEGADLLSAIIALDANSATLEVTEGTASSTATYKWYSYRATEGRESLLTSNSPVAPIQDLFGTGYLRCEIWDTGQRLLSVFERFYRPLTDGEESSITDAENVDISEL